MFCIGTLASETRPFSPACGARSRRFYQVSMKHQVFQDSIERKLNYYEVSILLIVIYEASILLIVIYKQMNFFLKSFPQ